MTIEAISFIIGGILIATAIVGGGFEIKEIKMPHVGAGPRFFSLIVGSLFIFMGVSAWGFDRQHLFNPALATNALTTGNAPFGDTVAAPVSEAPRQETSTEPASAENGDLPGSSPPAFPGFAGGVRLAWTWQGQPYVADLQTDGSTGAVRVYYDPGTGVEEVDQDVVLHEVDGQPFYQGMNPRYASNQEPHPTYQPDMFRVAMVDASSWGYTHVCSGEFCEAVTSVEALP